MRDPIVPDSAQGEKSNAAQKGPLSHKNKSQLLLGWIEETSLAMSALQAWLDKLSSWQSQEQVSRKEFEAAYAILRRASLEEWAKLGLDKLRVAVTGEETAEQP
jgi:hypothetical protein